MRARREPRRLRRTPRRRARARVRGASCRRRPVPASVRRRVPASNEPSSASSCPRPTNELASAGSEWSRRIGTERGQRLGQLGMELCELVAPIGGPVLVAVSGSSSPERRRALRGTRPACRFVARRPRRARSRRRRSPRRATEAPRARRSCRSRSRAPPRARPGRGCSPRRSGPGRATARPSPAPGAAAGPARARAASRGRAPCRSRHALSATGSPSTVAPKPPSSEIATRSREEDD